jgi:branched-subunit amino acid transport protein
LSSQQLSIDLLKNALKYDLTVGMSSNYKSTQGGSGYNFYMQGFSKPIYYHGVKKEPLEENCSYLFSYKSSTRVEGRNDIAAITKITNTSFEFLVDQIVQNPNFVYLMTVTLNVKELWQAIETRLLVWFSNSEEYLNHLKILCKLPPSIIDKLISKVALKHIPFFMTLGYNHSRTIEFIDDLVIKSALVEGQEWIRTWNQQSELTHFSLYAALKFELEVHIDHIDSFILLKLLNLLSLPNRNQLSHQVLVDRFWAKLELRNTLVAYFTKFPRASDAVINQISQEMPLTITGFNSYIHSYPEALHRIIISMLPSNAIFIKINLGRHINEEELIKGIFNNEFEFNEEEQELITNYLFDKNFTHADVLFAIIKGDVTANSFKTFSQYTALAWAPFLTNFNKELLLKIVFKGELVALITNEFYKHEIFQTAIPSFLSGWLKEGGEYDQQISFLKLLAEPIINDLVNKVCLKQIPLFIELGYRQIRVIDFIDDLVKKDDLIQLDGWVQTLRKNKEHRHFVLYAMINIKQEINETPNEEVFHELVDIFRSSESRLKDLTFIILSNAQYWEPLLKLACKSLEDKSWFSGLVCESVPLEEIQINTYLSCLDLIHRSKAINYAPLELLPSFVQNVSGDEKILIRYIVTHISNLTPSFTTTVLDIATRNNFFDSKLLYLLADAYFKRDNLDFYKITGMIKEYQRNLFDYHSHTRTKVESHIFSTCKYAEAIRDFNNLKIKNRAGLSLCEGKYIVPNKPSIINEENPCYVICRREKCSHIIFDGVSVEPNSFNDVPFYHVLSILFKISAEELHRKDAYIKTLAALNRWNEILPRLHCQTCNGPLDLSEHAQGSLGKMAVGVSFWHCGSKRCLEYRRSVKITYCIGCAKVIDSRVDTQSCVPHEIFSYKKFYICTSCGMCCGNHGFVGRCPTCGKNEAFNKVQSEGRTKAQCQFCDTSISISPQSFTHLKEQQNNKYIKQENGKLSNAKCHFVVPVSLFIRGSKEIFVHDKLDWDQPGLYVYDLFECLRSGAITSDDLNVYNYVYDLKIVEKIAELGLYHKKYNTVRHRPGILDLLEPLGDGATLESILERYIERIFELFDVMNRNELWVHYDTVEMPFLKVLHHLLERGLELNLCDLDEKFPQLELERNHLVEDLRDQGIDTPDRESVIEYLEHSYGGVDGENLVSLYLYKNLKVIADKHLTFSKLYQLEKIERAAGILKSFKTYSGYVIPHYQILGTDTGRCTARDPNILNLPKDYRPLIRARNGCGIVECDYNTGDVYQSFADSLSLSRDTAKVLFLAIIYGMSPSSLSKSLNCDIEKANALINGFFTRYSKVKTYQDEVVQSGIGNGYVSTVTGLKRQLNLQVNLTPKIEQWQRNWLKNFPVQANAAIIFKQAIISLSETLPDKGFKLLVPHYDAIVFQAPLSKLELYTSVVESTMISSMKKLFPILEPKVSINNHDVSCWNKGK